MKSLKVYLFLVSLIISSCSQIPDQKSVLTESVSPSTCRIIGTIESIEDFKDDTGACSTNHCIASVKIEKITQRGMNFDSPIAKNDVIDLKFEFTLSPTDSLFPELDTHLPGLVIGNKFTGDIERIISINVSDIKSIDTYRIYNYDKLKEDNGF